MKKMRQRRDFRPDCRNSTPGKSWKYRNCSTKNIVFYKRIGMNFVQGYPQGVLRTFRTEYGFFDILFNLLVGENIFTGLNISQPTNDRVLLFLFIGIIILI